jgi:hypothetical protein
VQLFAVASCMDEGRGLGRVPKCFEEKNVKQPYKNYLHTFLVTL